MNEEACTTIIVGSEMMADGSMIYARSDDSRSIRATRLVHYPAGKGPKEFVAIDSAFRCPLPARRFGFSALEREDLPYHWGEAGFNDRGVAMSATFSPWIHTSSADLRKTASITLFCRI